MAAFLLKPYSHLWWCYSILIAFEASSFLPAGFAVSCHALLRSGLPEQSIWPGAGGVIACRDDASAKPGN